jgi:glycosyltransferase involved in cell wall biosynthesis
VIWVTSSKSTLSVIVPVYNASSFLNETFDSLLHQTRPADQIVVVDDGSTDYSCDIIRQYQKKDSRIELITQRNFGVSSARNRALEHCKGDFIGLLDADDICERDRFKIQLSYMNKNNVDLCGSAVRTFGSKNRLIKYPKTSEELKKNYFFLSRTIANPTAMFRRSIVCTARYHEDISFAEDFGFFFSLVLQNTKLQIANIPMPLVNYRTHSQQASKQLSEKNFYSISTIFERLLPTVGIFPSSHQLKLHYKFWRDKESMCWNDILEYLPLMASFSKWLIHSTGKKNCVSPLWYELISAHRDFERSHYEYLRNEANPFLSLRRKINLPIIS